jgi:hypothetical protein
MAKTWNGSELSPIKRVLRSRESHQYFNGQGWTANLEEAKNFADVVEAASTCAHYGLSNVELAVRVSAAKCDLFCTPVH